MTGSLFTDPDDNEVVKAVTNRKYKSKLHDKKKLHEGNNYVKQSSAKPFKENLLKEPVKNTSELKNLYNYNTYYNYLQTSEDSSEFPEPAGELRGAEEIKQVLAENDADLSDLVTSRNDVRKAFIDPSGGILYLSGMSTSLTVSPYQPHSGDFIEGIASGTSCGKTHVGNHDSDRKEGESCQNKSSTHKHQQSGGGGDSCDLSLPSSGGSGDGRGGGDEKNNDDGKKKAQDKAEEEEDEEAEKKKNAEEEASVKKPVEATHNAKEETQIESRTVQPKQSGCVDTSGRTAEMKKEDELDGKGKSEDGNEMEQLVCNDIQRSLQEACMNIQDQKNGLAICHTVYSRNGDFYLRHLQQCRLGHLHCENCHQYLDSFNQLVSSCVKQDGAIFPFFLEYMESISREEKCLVILKWLYGIVPNKFKSIEKCRIHLKRLRLSSSQGAQNRKKFKADADSNSPEPMDTAVTPSPDGSHCGAASRFKQPQVFHGSTEDLGAWIQYGNHDDSTDGELNEGVILHTNLSPIDGLYRPRKEFAKVTRLGSGSSGEVYVAADKFTNQEFVCKKVHLDTFEINEVLIWMKLSHPNIIPLWGVVKHGAYMYILSEFFPSKPLPSRLANNDFSIQDANVVNWIRQILDVLKYIHSLKIVHMDIKPENLLLAGNKIYMIDWGLALNLNDNGFVQLNQATGTEFFMAPEVVRCERFNTAADIWSLMCTFINLLAGLPPWIKRFSKLLTYQLVIATHPPPIEDIPRDIHPAIRDFLCAGLQADQQDRATACRLLEHDIFGMNSFPRLSTEEMETGLLPVATPPGIDDEDDHYINPAACFPALGEEINVLPANFGTSSINQILEEASCVDQSTFTYGNVNQEHQASSQHSHQEDCPGVHDEQLQGRTHLENISMTDVDKLSNNLLLMQIKEDEEDLYGPGSPDDCTDPSNENTYSSVQPDDDFSSFHPLTAAGGQVSRHSQMTPDRSSTSDTSLFDSLFPDIGLPQKLANCSSDLSSTFGSLNQCGAYADKSTASGGPLNCQNSTRESRRSSGQSSVFEQMFPTLGSTPDEPGSAERASGTSDTFYTFHASTPTGNVTDNHRESATPPTDIQQPYVATRVDNGTSGYVSQATAQSHNSERKRNSSNHIVCINVLGEVLFALSTTLYGNLAEGISKEVYKIFKAKNIPISRFILTDEHGNQFDENDPVDSSIEVRVAIARDEDKWTWCVTPEDNPQH